MKGSSSSTLRKIFAGNKVVPVGEQMETDWKVSIPKNINQSHASKHIAQFDPEMAHAPVPLLQAEPYQAPSVSKSSRERRERPSSSHPTDITKLSAAESVLTSMILNGSPGSFEESSPGSSEDNQIVPFSYAQQSDLVSVKKGREMAAIERPASHFAQSTSSTPNFNGSDTGTLHVENVGNSSASKTRLIPSPPSSEQRLNTPSTSSQPGAVIISRDSTPVLHSSRLSAKAKFERKSSFAGSKFG